MPLHPTFPFFLFRHFSSSASQASQASVPLSPTQSSNKSDMDRFDRPGSRPATTSSFLFETSSSSSSSSSGGTSSSGIGSTGLGSTGFGGMSATPGTQGPVPGATVTTTAAGSSLLFGSRLSPSRSPVRSMESDRCAGVVFVWLKLCVCRSEGNVSALQAT